MAAGIPSPDGLPVVVASDRSAWRMWLESNHATERGAWLLLSKKGSPAPSASYDEAVEEALAFGWIDSRANALDEHRYLQRFTPRKPNSNWSSSNRERVARLTAEGRMAPAGLAAVDAAKRSGAWDGTGGYGGAAGSAG